MRCKIISNFINGLWKNWKKSEKIQNKNDLTLKFFYF